SRETFLANEALKRQREARNFVFKGDADAPTLTRSGRVISKAQEDDEDVEGDEYGPLPDQSVAEVDDGVTFVRRDDVHIALPVAKEKQTPKLVSLPEGARPHVLEILSTLNSRHIATNPPPFVDEEKNEALQGLLNLLKGTVERGEGNSALILGARGVGKTRTVTRALNLLPSTSKTTPIVVRLSGHGQPNDRLAIREMGRQIAEAEGHKVVHEDGDDEDATGEEGEFAPTTLPSHLLALLTAPSPRSIIIIIEEFDLFTEHARQALLYCLLDVVQSIKTGPVETTGRGVAVIGLTSRVDSLLLLEKRVKSRFSHRMWRVASPLAPEGMGWKELLRKGLVPWDGQESATEKEDKAVRTWKDDWQFAIETLLEHEKIGRYLDRLTGLSTDVRNLYRPFIKPMSEILCGTLDFLSIPDLTTSILNQLELSGWGLQQSKLKGLPHPALGVLIIAKHLAFAGREEFGFAMVEEEYLRFARTKLVGSGKVRWPIGVLRTAFDHLLRLSLLVPISNTTVKPQFAKVRCTLAPHETVAFFKADGGAGMGPEMISWGRLMGGHA
ncbi:origin recognition complex subunit 4 C-terminus-domain-containing protein, partial [Naematelia encephala]